MIEVTPKADTALLPGYVRIAAEINHGRPHWYRQPRKETLWFDVPQARVSAVDQSGDYWLMALLPLAFDQGRTLRIHAPVDPRMLEQAGKLQAIWSGWFPPRKPITIKAETGISPGPSGWPDKIGLFFTGGVDSFFSLLHFDETAGDGQKIDDLIFVWGYDIPLSNRPTFESKLRSLQKVADAFGKNLIAVVTNLRETRVKLLDWGMRSHGTALGAVGLLLSKRFKKILFSSTQGPDDLSPWGSHRLTTPLMSSRLTQFREFGGEFHRFEKTERVALSETALAHLQVCWRDEADSNCGRCEKCYRTLLALELIGRRAQAVTFPQDDFSLAKVKNIELTSGLMYSLFEEILIAAKARNRQDVIDAIESSLKANRAKAASARKVKN